MNLSQQQDLKRKMLHYRQSFMREKFENAAQKTKENIRNLMEMMEDLLDLIDDAFDRGKFQQEMQNLSLHLSHAEFTYDPNDPDQINTINELMKDTSGLLNVHGERLNGIIDNYPEIATAYDHIYDTVEGYPDAVEEVRLDLSPTMEPTRKRELSPSGPSLDYTP